MPNRPSVDAFHCTQRDRLPVAYTLSGHLFRHPIFSLPTVGTKSDQFACDFMAAENKHLEMVTSPKSYHQF